MIISKKFYSIFKEVKKSQKSKHLKKVIASVHYNEYFEMVNIKLLQNNYAFQSKLVE